MKRCSRKIASGKIVKLGNVSCWEKEIVLNTISLDKSRFSVKIMIFEQLFKPQSSEKSAMDIVPFLQRPVLKKIDYYGCI